MNENPLLPPPAASELLLLLALFVSAVLPPDKNPNADPPPPPNDDDDSVVEGATANDGSVLSLEADPPMLVCKNENPLLATGAAAAVCGTVSELTVEASSPPPPPLPFMSSPPNIIDGFTLCVCVVS
jgi:hypothetical protein